MTLQPAAAQPMFGFQYHIEEARWVADLPAVAIRIKGWGFAVASHLRIAEFHARQGARLLARCAAASRPDVLAHFAGAPHAEFAGFDLPLPPLDPFSVVEIDAVFDDGMRQRFYSRRCGDFPGRRPMFHDYIAWVLTHDPNPPAVQPALSVKCRFSVLMPVYNPSPAHLQEALDSVLNQYLPAWELCLVDDASTSSAVRSLLADYAERDPRIRLNYRHSNGGIARASNDGLSAATGEYVVLLDHDDILRPHALQEFSRAIELDPAVDVLYSDEDKLNPAGQRCLPMLKPGYSPEFLKGVMYAGHALCVRTAVARAAGGFDPAFDGIQDYEFLLRVTELTGRVRHIPRILYHWRQAPQSSALQGNVKGDMDEKMAQAVQAHLRRSADSRLARALGGHRVRLEPTALSSFTLVRIEDATDILQQLRTAATSSSAEVLIAVVACATTDQSGWSQELAALAARPDSACVVPHLLSREGLILESGRMIHDQQFVGLMRGLDPTGDGYNGTLVCHREVDAVSPACVAVRRDLVETTGPSASNWLAFCARLRAKGLYHRVCASVQMRLPVSWTEPAGPAAGQPDTREFYNRHFDFLRGDYTMDTGTGVDAPTSQFRFHVDQPTNWNRLGRCLILRGWCFATTARPLERLRLRLPGRVIDAVVGLPRPDVKIIFPDAPSDYVGFEIRGILPTSHFRMIVEAQLGGGKWVSLLERSVQVKPQRLPLWLGGGGWQELMFFQMPGHSVHAPRSLRKEKFPDRRAGKPMPRIAIVTPSFNQARFLAETIGGILDRQDVACDYVVQDGGSTDGSAELIRQQSSRLHAWASERDAGQADAIAKGFAKTSGGPDDLMAWINSDDFYLPGTLGFVADYFARHPEVDVIYGHRILVDENSQEIGRWFLPRHDPEVLRLNDFVPQETMFWRRRIWDKVGGIDPSFKFAMDWDLLLRFQAAGAKIVRVPYFLACFRIHSAQKTSAQMHSVGQAEITRLRERTFGRPFPPAELETNPTLLRYLRRSAFIEFLWKLGIRAS